MSTLYTVFRIANMVFIGFWFIQGVIGLVQTLNSSDTYDLPFLIGMIISIVVSFLGVWGSYKHHRIYLTTFAIFVLVVLILNCFSLKVHYPNVGNSILVAVLALVQAELIKRGHSFM